MSKILMIGGIALAAWYIWNNFINVPGVAAAQPLPGQLPAGTQTPVTYIPPATTTTPAVTTTTPPVTTPVVVPAVTMQQKIMAALNAAAAANGNQLNVDQWAWYAKEAAGRDIGNLDAFNASGVFANDRTRSTPMSLNVWLAQGGTTYIAQLAGAGISGLGLGNRQLPSPVRVHKPKSWGAFN